jgi:hypothetical protein
MEGHEQLAKMTKVRAPLGFEGTVLARLPAARRERQQARRALTRYAFAGSAALVLAGFLVFGPVNFEKDTVLTYAEREALSATPAGGQGGPSAASRSRLVPVFETMDYASEFRNVRTQPPTVYILEQVSESRSSEIVY